MRLSNTDRKYGTNRAIKNGFSSEYKPTWYHRNRPHMWGLYYWHTRSHISRNKVDHRPKHSHIRTEM